MYLAKQQSMDSFRDRILQNAKTGMTKLDIGQKFLTKHHQSTKS